MSWTKAAKLEKELTVLILFESGFQVEGLQLGSFCVGGPRSWRPECAALLEKPNVADFSPSCRLLAVLKLLLLERLSGSHMHTESNKSHSRRVCWE